MTSQRSNILGFICGAGQSMLVREAPKYGVLRMDLARLGKLMSSQSRVRILVALMGGKALPASELAFRAGVSNQTASEHLAALENADLIRVRKCGRHRYYEISGNTTAESLETFAAAFPPSGPPTNSQVPENLRIGRFCYDHLAGKLGVGITEALIRMDAIRPDERDYSVTDGSHFIFVEFGIDVEALKKKKRNFARQCIDWSERCPHLAGSLGASFSEKLLELGWIHRSRDDRSASVSPEGQRGLERAFGIQPLK